MSLDNNSIKIDDNQIENLDSNNQNSSFSKKKIDINTTTQSDNADKDFISKEQSNQTTSEINSPKIPWYKNYKNKRIMIIFSMALICSLVIGFLVFLLIKSKKNSKDKNQPEIDKIPEIIKPENETKPEEEIIPKNETQPEEETKTEEKIELEEESKTEEETKNEEKEKTEEKPEEEKNELKEEIKSEEPEEEIMIKEEEIEEEEKIPVLERLNLEDIDIEEVNTIIGERVEENHKMINDSLNNIDGILNNIETIKSEVVNKINYDPNNLTIPSFLTDPPSGSNAHKITIAKEDFDLYNEKYKELSEKANEFSQNTSDSINEITEPINNLRDEIDEISEQFDEIMKNLCLPLILEQKGLINTSESNLRRLDELREEYKSLVKQFNKFYQFFLNSLNFSIDAVVKVLEEIINSNKEFNDDVNIGISNYKEIISNTDIDNVHDDLIKIKDNFLNLKEELKEKINKFDESISNFEILNKKLQNDFLEFQNNFDDLIENITGISNLYLEKTNNIREIELINNNKNCSNLNIYSTLNSIFTVYETTIKIQYATKERYHSIEITISIIEMKTSLDLLFVLDITGSMNPYLSEIKSKLIEIINRIIDQSPGIDINLGFIGYRDKGENYTDIDFTQNHDDLKAQIENLNVYGGGDIPEDVLFALQLTLKKSWKSNAKFIVFVADAPGRGEKEIENSLEQLAGNNVSMFCLRIHSRTDNMFTTFQNVYKKYESVVFKIVDKSVFINEVVNSCIDYYSTHRDIK